MIQDRLDSLGNKQAKELGDFNAKNYSNYAGAFK